MLKQILLQFQTFHCVFLFVCFQGGQSHQLMNHVTKQTCKIGLCDPWTLVIGVWCAATTSNTWPMQLNTWPYWTNQTMWIIHNTQEKGVRRGQKGGEQLGPLLQGSHQVTVSQWIVDNRIIQVIMDFWYSYVHWTCLKWCLGLKYWVSGWWVQSCEHQSVQRGKWARRLLEMNRDDVTLQSEAMWTGHTHRERQW